jgi:hypothetical protein
MPPRSLLAAKDASVATELATLGARDWRAMAEAPPGQLPAHLAVSHFVLDSWVHEYDLMVPRGEHPVMDPVEAETVVGYLIGLASVQTGADTSLDLRLTRPDLRVGLEVVNQTVHVTSGSTPQRGRVIEGNVTDLVDRATGRDGGPVQGDVVALAVLDGFASLLAR